MIAEKRNYLKDQRIKTGMEVAPELLDGLKERAREHDVFFWEVVDEAFRRYLETMPDVPLRLREYPAKFYEILMSGHTLAIEAVTRNVDAFLELVRLTAEDE